LVLQSEDCAALVQGEEGKDAKHPEDVQHMACVASAGVITESPNKMNKV
jgi:hypothetical protein